MPAVSQFYGGEEVPYGEDLAASGKTSRSAISIGNLLLEFTWLLG